MIKTVIIDDEKNVQQTIGHILEKLCPDVKVVGTANSVESGVELLSQNDIDLVFLDIKMPGGTGFDILRRLEDRRFHVIFTTAYNEYAMQAIKMNALDYLLKPVDSGELVAAVQKYRQHGPADMAFGQLLQHFKPGNDFRRIAVNSVGEVRYLDMDDIVRLESDGAYTNFYCLGKEVLLSSKPLKHYEDILEKEGFLRLNRSNLVNMKLVSRYKKTDSNDKVEMKDGSVIELYRRHRSKFLKAMEEKINL